jgi:hypothetical protein
MQWRRNQEVKQNLILQQCVEVHGGLGLIYAFTMGLYGIYYN